MDAGREALARPATICALVVWRAAGFEQKRIVTILLVVTAFTDTAAGDSERVSFLDPTTI